MSKSLKEKFDNINLDAIPEHLSFEIKTIQEETSDFTDEDAMEIFAKNFNFLYSAIEKKYPTTLNDYVAPAPPEPTAEEIEAKRLADEAERAKEEKIRKAAELAAKYKKKPAQV